MIYCLNPACPHPKNPDGNVHCQYCGVRIALRDRFKALKLIGQGGFGRTYLAEDLDNRNKPCVIKRFTYQGADDYATEKARQLFEQEAERLDQLVHPQIPRLLAYFQEENYLYLVQEVIVGQTLHAELQSQGLFDEAKIRALLQGLLPVLQFVHNRSVIHRDIKPDNIMRKRHGDLVLIDFGVAKFLEESGFSNASTTIGTPGYAAPEQIQGRVKPASDLFALGATCFQLLTDAFETNAVSTAGYGWVRKWQSYVKLPVSDELAAILTKLMAVEECDRYTTATEVLQDLEAGRHHHLAPVIQSGPPPSQLPTVAAAPNIPPISPPIVNRPVSNPPAASVSNNPPSTSGGPTSVPPTPLGFVSPNSISLNPIPFNSPSTASSTPSSTSAPTDLSIKVGTANPTPIHPHHLSPLPPVAAPPHGQAAIKKNRIGAGFCIRYGLFSHAGHIVGAIVACLLVLFSVASTHPDPENLSPNELTSIMQLLAWMHWPIAGFSVGLAQWLVVRRYLQQSLWWIPATVAGFWVIALAVATGYANALGGIVVGLAVGLAQWFVIRQQTSRAGWWVLWNMMSIAVLCYAISVDFPTTLGWLIISPLMDGLFLGWVLRNSWRSQ